MATTREKFEALVNGDELRSFALPTNEGMSSMYLKLDDNGNLVQGAVTINDTGHVIERHTITKDDDPYPIYEVYKEK